MKVKINTYANRDEWMFVILPEIGFFRDHEEYGFEICWLCFCFEINNK